MGKQVCTWCNRVSVTKATEFVVSVDHQARWWKCYTCEACRDCIRDLLDDASMKKNGGARQLGWWENAVLYPVS